MAVVHRFWAGPDMPAEYARFGKEWERLNDLLVIDHGLEVLEEMEQEGSPLLEVVEDLYRRDDFRYGIELYVQIADVVGYWLLAAKGGLYVNCDIEPIRPFPQEMLASTWASLENDEDGRIVNAAMGARGPGDSFWSGLVSSLPARYFSNPKAEMVWSTGPAYLTDYAHAHPTDLRVYPRTAFNPIHWKLIAEGGDATPFFGSIPQDTIGVHHWGHRKTARTNFVETATQP